MSREDFEGAAALAKQNHDERVAKTPDRIEYAIRITVLWYSTEPDSKAEIVLSLLGVAMGTVGLTLILI